MVEIDISKINDLIEGFAKLNFAASGISDKLLNSEPYIFENDPIKYFEMMPNLLKPLITYCMKLIGMKREHFFMK